METLALRIRVQRLCHLYDSVLLNGQVVPAAFNQRVTNESVSEVHTNYLYLRSLETMPRSDQGWILQGLAELP